MTPNVAVNGLLSSVDALGPTGAWRELRARAALVPFTGLRHAWRRLRHDVRHARVAEEQSNAVAAEIWTDAADELGATVHRLSARFFEIRRGSAVTRVLGQATALNDLVAIRLAGDKALARTLLRRGGLPVPEQLEFQSSSPRPAFAFLEEFRPCVVKPSSASGGDGVTAEVRTDSELRRATVRAARFDDRLLIERQVVGSLYRLLLLDGEVLGTVRRLPPRVTGDGSSTIGELILTEYARRIGSDGHAGLKPLAADLDCVLTLRQRGLSLRSIIDAGVIVPVKTATNQNRPEDNETGEGGCSHELAEECARAARILGLRLAGVDVVAGGLDSSLRQAGGVILEVNGEPALHYHYQVAEPSRAVRVAVPILSTLLQENGSEAPAA